MNKTLKWFLIGISGAILLYFAASFVAVFMLTYFSSSKRIENKSEEKIFEKIKREYHIEEIERNPKYEREIKDKDTVTYTLYLYSKDFCNLKTDSLTKNSLKIAKELNSINLDPKFYQYRLVFCCKLYNPNGTVIQYLRKDLMPKKM
ncbi:MULTISPECIES: hypothetical protein [unclassified Chryseobacterium]|uniref:hypothetical protein n=1 Tax=unclassified Chryseobacterium TaxID=2593645 RepID=UPI00100B0F0F|nr:MULTISPECIES: hypothetical protein [unclassified Chryseobacterium]RXM52408.1 hypothetical protein BOQ64_05890 [Chryseobacterium sp. CH25]RXM66469.1 hypothetical protein BOQ60_00365 [Chryseobacterium sp. CH1]